MTVIWCTTYILSEFLTSMTENQVTWLSSPMVSNIKKNSTAHNGEMGNLATASGYATNTRPGPGT